MLMLAAIAATIAVLGALNLVNNASATIPGGTTVTVTDNTTGVVPLGSIITHTKSLVLDGGGTVTPAPPNQQRQAGLDDGREPFRHHRHGHGQRHGVRHR